MLDSLRNRLIDDWHFVLKRSWSVRFMALSCLFEGLNAVLPRYETFFSFSAFSVLTFACTVAALAARFVAQSKDTD